MVGIILMAYIRSLLPGCYHKMLNNNAFGINISKFFAKTRDEFYIHTDNPLLEQLMQRIKSFQQGRRRVWIIPRY